MSPAPPASRAASPLPPESSDGGHRPPHRWHQGHGLAVSVVIDATVVRLVTVPAAVFLTGRANWWPPRRLDRVLPHFTV
ncbi:hypothetical protein ACFWSF_39620 [Streptomyces sp. NPDC058611]|uniref:hypothetical protein n=1 Tax=unclassified Streptomyces TaxID=2593676 RepID=UPI003664C35D